MIRFVKMHGTGNDFPVIGDLDNQLDISADAVRRLTDRHFGIGGDGLIRIVRSKRSDAEFFMDYRNADGTLAETCGNGIRVCGKWLGDRGYVDDVVNLETRGGVQRLTLQRGSDGFVSCVTVNMGKPVGDVCQEALLVDGASLAVTLVNYPNPHAVLYVDDVDLAPVSVIGSRIERHSRFANGTNVEFVDQIGGVLRQRTWERGVGETLACGSGACAVAVSARRAGYVDNQAVVELRGGRLSFEWDADDSLLMSGPAEETFAGEFSESWL